MTAPTCGFVEWADDVTDEQLERNEGYTLCGEPAATRRFQTSAAGAVMYDLCDAHASAFAPLLGERIIALPAVAASPAAGPEPAAPEGPAPPAALVGEAPPSVLSAPACDYTEDATTRCGAAPVAVLVSPAGLPLGYLCGTHQDVELGPGERLLDLATGVERRPSPPPPSPGETPAAAATVTIPDAIPCVVCGDPTVVETYRTQDGQRRDVCAAHRPPAPAPTGA